ncbi:hypothetical protein MD484_g8125, partial [Candolleomyces efflorescens]
MSSSSEPVANTLPPDVPGLDIWWKYRTEGAYDAVADLIHDLGEGFLGNVIYKKHFVRSLARFGGNYLYRRRDGNEMEVFLFGEIVKRELGTAVGAAGTYKFESPDGTFAPITDKTRVKDRLALAAPTYGTRQLNVMFDNQIATLNDIRMADEGEEAQDNKSVQAYEWVKASVDDPSDAPADLILVNLGYKYVDPNKENRGNFSSSGDGSPRKRICRQSVPQGRGTDAEEDTYASATVTGRHEVESLKEAVDAHGRKVGTFYDPALLPDYGGPCFRLKKNKMVQADFRDSDGDLIPPWQYHDDLRPGTIVSIRGTLHCFVMPAKDGQVRDKKVYYYFATETLTSDEHVAQFYQINAKSLNVLLPSNIPVVMPEVPEAPAWATGFASSSSPAAASAGTSKDGASVTAAFNRFKASIASPGSARPEHGNVSPKEDGEVFEEIPAIPSSAKGKGVARRNKRKNDASMDCE